ncbi:hemerythrin domain-containing protein [Streptomyces sp. HPF1205]|uniref:hemerythrin domain-containing protein n=1 Tax=Streptomyces sp. HPF1205 TaxID=2873262 RepID=UPI001CEDDEA4|nr:hemerythrin domain-containing protein [Streptomyces sp. HPF1205]
MTTPFVPSTPHVPGAAVDLTMMYAFHDGLRRDSAIIAKSAAVTGDDPARLTATHFGWDLFKRLLTIHHKAEDDILWPRLTELLEGRGQDDLEMLEAMEAEHGRIDPLIEAIDSALADEQGGHAGLGDAVDAFVTELHAHLTHEEKEALPLIDAKLPPADWAKFADSQRDQIGRGLAPSYVPWILDGATPERVEQLLAIFPPPVVGQYRGGWKDQYARTNPWASEYGKA